MKIRFSSTFLKADEVKDGQTITILDGGIVQESQKFTYQDGSPKKEFIFSVEYNGDKKSLRMNAQSRRAMVDAFGDETESWIGKTATMFIFPTPNGDKKMIVLKPNVENDDV